MLCKLFVLFIDEIVILIVCLGFLNVGSLVCIVIVVIFFILGFKLLGKVILKLFSMVLKFCCVNWFCLFVFGKLIIRL